MTKKTESRSRKEFRTGPAKDQIVSPPVAGRNGSLPFDARRVTWFRNAQDAKAGRTATLGETFRVIQTKDLPVQKAIRKLTGDIAKAKTNGHSAKDIRELEKRKTALKESTPGFSLSGVFEGRRSNDTLVEHSGLLQIDIDHVADSLDEIIEQLKTSPYVYAIWDSISGDGIKAAIVIPQDKEQHKAAFESARQHVLELTGVEIDEQTKDPARICFFSHDADLWTNPKARQIPVVLPGKKKPTTTTTPITDIDPSFKSIREIGEKILGDIGELITDDKGRPFWRVRCPDFRREHHETGDTRLYPNPGGVPFIFCNHGLCKPHVDNANEWLRRLLDEDRGGPRVSLPLIENMADLVAANIPLPPDVVTNVLHQGGKMVLGGGSKSFKTWQQLDLLLSVSLGKPWLNFQTIKGKVLYLNFELPREFCPERVRMICKRREMKLDRDTFDVLNLRGFAMDVQRFVPLVMDRVADNKYTIIDVDPLYKLLGSTRDENKAGDIAVVLNALERLAVTTGASVLFGAHYSKGNQASKESIDRISGSGVFARDPDTIMNFTRHEEEGAYVVESILRNHPPIEDFCVRWNHPLMEVATDLDPSKLKKQPTNKGGQPAVPQSEFETIASLLDAGPLSYGEYIQRIMDELKMPKSTAENRYRALKKCFRIIKTDDKKKWTKNPEFIRPTF